VKSYTRRSRPDSRVLVSARKMKELGAGTSKDLPDPDPVEREPRAVASE
jgi:hypothetical protein